MTARAWRPRWATWSAAAAFVHSLLVIMLILALILSIMTTMAGSSRTLYQGSVDGWLPKYLSGVNEHGAPTRAMWTDLGFNLILLMMSDYVFVLAVSNVCYLVFNFLNLNAGWIHRIDNAKAHRPWRAPTFMLGAGVGPGLRQHGLPGRRREGLGRRHAGLGPGRHGSRGALLRLAPLHRRQGPLPGGHARRSARRRARPEQSPRRQSALSHLGGRRAGGDRSATGSSSSRPPAGAGGPSHRPPLRRPSE